MGDLVFDSSVSPIQTLKNKSQERLSKNRRDAITKRLQKQVVQLTTKLPSIQTKPVSSSSKGNCRLNIIPIISDEYEMVNSEDKVDQDAKSMDDNEEVSDLNSQDELQQEIQEATEKQGMSPRGRRDKRHNKKTQ